MPSANAIVAITGVSGYLGSVLACVLDDDPRVKLLVGLDSRNPALTLGKLEFHQHDITAPGLAQILVRNGVTHVAHLAFCMSPNHNRAWTRQVNVGGSQNVLHAAAAAGVQQLVFASSSVVYGAHRDNPIPIPEHQPLRSTPQVQYTLDKIDVERHCDQFRRSHPEINVSVLRLVTIVGPGVDNFIFHFLEKPTVVIPRGFDRPWQFIHELDAARAFQAALFSDRSGTYNVGADESIRLTEILKELGKPTFAMPRRVMKLVVNIGWYLRLKRLTEIPGALIDYMCYPPVLCNEKVKKQLEFQFTSRQAIATYLQAKLTPKTSKVKDASGRKGQQANTCC